VTLEAIRLGRNYGRGDGKRIGRARPAAPERRRYQFDGIRDRYGALPDRSLQVGRPPGVVLSRA
jgi:hypothetical protein